MRILRYNFVLTNGPPMSLLKYLNYYKTDCFHQTIWKFEGQYRFPTECFTFYVRFCNSGLISRRSNSVVHVTAMQCRSNKSTFPSWSRMKINSEGIEAGLIDSSSGKVFTFFGYHAFCTQYTHIHNVIGHTECR